jgi:hypothetical protein
MTEYELVDTLASLNGNIIQGQALTVTIISAYMVVAYNAGVDLTKFQVMFTSLVLMLFGLLGAQGQSYAIEQFTSYSAQLNELRGGAPRNESAVEIAKWAVLVLRVFLIGGSLTFMWRVRHPKTG